MKFKLIVFSCLFFIINDFFVTTNGYLPVGLKETRLKQYPFMAVLPGWRCSAVLITQQHLIIPQKCIESETTTTVDFDFEYLPPYFTNTQNYTISRIIKDEHEQNKESGIVVLELERPVTFSDTIRPAKLISEEEFDLFEENATGQMIGLWKGYTSALSVEVLELEDRYRCKSYIRRSRPLKDEEKLCAATFTNNGYIPFYGNAMTFQNKVAGLLIGNYCDLPELSASECIMMFLDVVPYLKWISKHVNVSVEELTGTVKTIEEIKQAKIEALEHEVLSKFESYKEAQTKFEKAKLEYHLELAQQTKLEFQTNNSIQEAKITKIETECIDKTEENFKKLLNDMQEKENERFNNLEEQMNNITEYLKSFTVRINKIVDYIAKVPPSN